MIEITEEQATFIVNKKSHQIIFVNSPFCGTCKVAKNMLFYLEETLEGEKFYELNGLTAPRFLQDYNIMSVPCLIVFQNGKPIDRLYTFHTVPYLLKELSPYLVSKENSN